MSSIPRKQLFYATLGGQLASVGVSSKVSTLQLESPEMLFRAFDPCCSFARPGGLAIGAQPFDISRDGQRFLIATTGNAEPTPITVVVNWDAELKKK